MGAAPAIACGTLVIFARVTSISTSGYPKTYASLAAGRAARGVSLVAVGVCCLQAVREKTNAAMAAAWNAREITCFPPARGTAAPIRLITRLVRGNTCQK